LLRDTIGRVFTDNYVSNVDTFFAAVARRKSERLRNSADVASIGFGNVDYDEELLLRRRARRGRLRNARRMRSIRPAPPTAPPALAARPNLH
jgi:hypothetical protein